jgi:trimeric autotransporter adhesin
MFNTRSAFIPKGSETPASAHASMQLMRIGNLAALALAACLFAASAAAQQYTISTVAGNGAVGYSGDGGAATDAQLFTPAGVALDASGNLYIADANNNVVRKVTPSGTISTVAGKNSAGYTGDGGAATSAELSNPIGLAVDSAGNLYIADTNNDVVRKVNTSGVISTYAGSTIFGYHGDGGAATSAGMDRPAGLALDAAGNLFIADMGNNVIRKVSTSGTITTVVGTGKSAQSLNHPIGVAVDAAGTLYVADTLNQRIVKYAGNELSTLAGDYTSGFSGDGGKASNALLMDPMAVAVDAAGNVYIADTINSRIRKVTPAGIITTIAGRGTGFSGDGGIATAARMLFPRALVLDAGGNIYVADSENNRVRLLQAPAPAIGANGVLNAASYAQEVSPGSLASVFGANFSTSGAQATDSSVSVLVNGQAAPITYAGSGQINFQVPWGTPTGTAKVTVAANGKTSNSISVPVTTAAPGLFFDTSSGQAVVLNTDSSQNAPANPAPSGSTITAFLTGSGPVNPQVTDGAAAPDRPVALITSPYSAAVGSSPARVDSAVLAPGRVGLVQMTIVVPPGLAPGDYPLSITIAGQTSNTATISVSAGQ